MAISSIGGSWKNCPQCGNLFFVGDVEHYAYKRSVTKNGNQSYKYFCKWSCLRKFDDEYEKKKAEMRKAKGWRKKAEA